MTVLVMMALAMTALVMMALVMTAVMEMEGVQEEKAAKNSSFLTLEKFMVLGRKSYSRQRTITNFSFVDVIGMNTIPSAHSSRFKLYILHSLWIV